MVSHEDVRLLKTASVYRRRCQHHQFWYEGVSQARVGGETKLVKIYNKKAGGEDGFLQDLRYLAQNVYVCLLFHAPLNDPSISQTSEYTPTRGILWDGRHAVCCHCRRWVAFAFGDAE